LKISVIVPVYNVALYLKACLDSIVAAANRLGDSDSTASVELICVDDGSTDSSGAILDSYASSIVHSPSSFTFCVFHQANAGVSAARNRGMVEATGELVTFLDADDTYDVRALEVLAEVWRKTGAEVIRYGCNTVADHAQDVPLVDEPQFDEVDLHAETTSPLRRCSLGWATAISSRLSKIVSWPFLTHCEDPLFVLRCMRASRKNIFVDAALANYLVRPGSAARTVSLKIITATCRYLVMAYDECASMSGFEKSRADTCAFISVFLKGPLAKCGRDVAPSDRVAAEAAVRTASNLLAARDAAFAPFACREIHDFAFVLGSSCTATDVLRQAGLQYGTFPLDWIGRLSVAVRTDSIVGDFVDFLDCGRLVLEESANDGRHARYVDSRYGTAFFHDFPVGKPLAEVFPVVQGRYNRRTERFLRYLREAKSVLVVWISDFRDGRDGVIADDGAMTACLDRLEKKFSDTHFSMLVFDQAEAGAAPCERTVVDGRIRRVTVDYRDWAQGTESWALRADVLLPYLRMHLVHDYRTPDERRAHARSARKAKYAKLHATSWFDMLKADIQYRLFKHLQKRLEGRGVKLS